MEKIKFTPDGEEAIDFYILETTRLGGKDYILVTEEPDGDGEAYILRDTSDEASEEAVYEFVESEEELQAVGQVFASIMDDIDLR